MLVSLAILTLLAAGAAPGQAGVRTERRAHAFLLFPDRDGRRPFVFVSVHEVTGQYEGFGLGRGFCYGDAIPESCAVERRSILADELREGDVFEIDPALDTAYLKIRRRGITHEMTWTAGGDPAPFTTEQSCGALPGSPSSAGLSRAATASGTVFGREMTTSTARGGSASLTAEAFGC